MDETLDPPTELNDNPRWQEDDCACGLMKKDCICELFTEEALER